MIKQIENLDDLISSAIDYYKFGLQRKMPTTDLFRRDCKRVKKFIELYKLDLFSNDLKELFLRYFFNGCKYSELAENGKRIFNCIDTLREFAITGKIEKSTGPHPKLNIVFCGQIGMYIEEFIANKQNENRIKQTTVERCKRLLFYFYNYCNKKEISLIEEIDFSFILSYLHDYKSNIKTDIIKTITSLREFFRYLYDNEVIKINLSAKIPRYKRVDQAEIPTVYPKEIIEKLISSIERSSDLGKRDYAIILIIARLGIRVSDIMNLQFEHLQWDSSSIIFEQTKTGESIMLPLLPDIGNAIIDYLRYARPQSKEPYVFLRANHPYGRLKNGNVSEIVKRALLREGIYIQGKRCGAHSLRHSLSQRMLENNTTLPIISEVLGHTSIETTRFYIRIDINSMKKCMLDVPQIPASFYNQRGEAFYE